MRIFFLCVLLATAASLASAADLSGKWNGNLEVTTPNGDTATDTAWTEFAQKGQEVTGTAGGGQSDQSFPIEKASFDGKTLVFQVTTPNRVFNIRLDLVAEDRLEGTINFTVEDGTKLSGKFKLKREAKAKQ